MPRRLPWKTLAIGGAVLGVGVLIVSRRSKAAPVTRVALIGDSYAIGLGQELEKMLPDFQWEGHVGTTTRQWANRVRTACDQCGDWLTSFKPDVVLVSLGVNDGATTNPTNYQNIVKGIQSIGARVVWIEPPAAVQTVSRDVISALGVQTIPATTSPLSRDGLHPQSYAGWAQEVAEAVQRA